jgi:hypothetical protein
VEGRVELGKVRVNLPLSGGGEGRIFLVGQGLSDVAKEIAVEKQERER